MNEFNFPPDVLMRARAAAAALNSNDTFTSLLETVRDAMVLQRESSAVDAIRRGDAHTALTLASEAQGITDFLSSLQRLDPDYALTKTSSTPR